MGERDGEESDGADGMDVDLEAFAPLSEDGEEAATTIDLSLPGALAAVDPDATYQMPTTNAGQADLLLPGRTPITNILIIAGGVALLAAAATIGIVLANRGGDEATTAANAPTTAGGGDTLAQDASALATATETGDRETDAAIAADAGVGEAQADSGPGDAALDADNGADAAFVIEDPEIPPAVQRMGPRTRARRARRQRRVALRLHGRMNYARAEEIWRRAVVLQPDNRYTQIGLARTLRALDRNHEADAWQARADAAAPMRRRRRHRRRRNRMR